MRGVALMFLFGLVKPRTTHTLWGARAANPVFAWRPAQVLGFLSAAAVWLRRASRPNIALKGTCRLLAVL